MRKLGTVAVALALTVAAVGSGDHFRRDSDTLSWFLRISDARYTVEVCDQIGNVSRFEGKARQVDQFVLLDSFGKLIGAAEKGETRFVKRQFVDEFYLVEEERREEFDAALREDGLLRLLLLRDFFRQITD